ncbi:MAG: heavy metal translocating P-type ATPase [Candidatus Ornithomonoglobus sp.]
MRFNIVHDMKGRIRLRSGGGYFSKQQEKPLEELLTALPYVRTASVSGINGGMLITYEPSHRAELLEYIRSVRISTVEKREIVGNELTDLFKRNLSKMIIRRMLMKYLLPAPVRLALTYVRAYPYIRNALRSLFNLRADVDLLDGVAVGAALMQGMYQEVGSIIFLLKISGLLEDYTRKRTKNALAESLSLKVDTVWKITDDKPVKTPLSKIQKDDRVIFRDGGMVAVDGTVISGQAMVNEASMTGEPLPVLKKEGATVYAGTVIEEGSIVVLVQSAAKNTRISHIVDMIENGENMKAGVQSRAEKLADGIVPYTLGFSVLTYLFTRNVTKALSVLMVDYSCAIKLTTPISIISAMREASGRGFVVKGGKHLESFAHADTIVFDKTGTLTNACPVVEKVIPFGEYSEDEVLKISACLEEHFPHSVAKAVVRAAHLKGLHHEEEHAEVKYVVAHGIVTMLHGERAIIGSEHFVFEDEGVELKEEQRAFIEAESSGYSTIYLAIAGRLAGIICISDPPREEAAEAVCMLKNKGIHNVMMLTGDHISAAERTAQMLGIEQFEAQVLPEDKARIVSDLKEDGRTVIMVGDGINDSPALALSDVSVAMKDSSDLAREVADITLLSGDMRDLALLRELSERLFRRITHNYGFIVAFNTALILLGLGGFITPSLSSLLHNGSTMLISAHSMKPLLKE